MEQFEIVARTPKERTHARTRWSEPAFVAEYGEDGLYGVILVVAMLITPGATAYLWTRRFRRMLLIAPLVAWVSCITGILLSFNVDVSTGGTIVLVQSAIFGLTYLFAPREGLVRSFLTRR